MDPELRKFLEAVEKRSAQAGVAGGVSLASAWVKGLLPCLADPACADTFFGLGTAGQYADALKAAEGRLVWSGGAALGGVSLKAALPRVWAAADAKELLDGEPYAADDFKAAKGGTPGAVMEFDAVVTSTRKDRDRDVLESSGAELDERMPLLWQHIPVAPIGKMVKPLGQSSKRVTARFAVADTPLGNDGAQLVEFGALRISHGFIPTEFERLKPEKGEEEWMAGWHVTKFKVVETSLVSVPSNEDAVILAFSRSKLHHPLVKAWATALWEKTPATVRVAKGLSEIGACFAKGCGCGHATHPEPPPAPAAPAQWEAERTLTDTVLTVSVDNPAPAARVLGMAAGQVLTGAELSGGRLKLHFAAKGKVSSGDLSNLSDAMTHTKAAMTHDGTPGTASTLCQKAHDNVEQVYRRHCAAADGKAAANHVTQGLRLSAGDRGLLDDAALHLFEAKGMDGVPKTAQTFMLKAHGLVSGVRDRHAPADADGDGDGDKGLTASALAGRLLGKLGTGEGVPLPVLRSLADQANLRVARADEAEVAALFR